MGIVEGITEWLPISSTGHMILLEQIIKFNASEEFMSMFRVVIQLGAIMAVVVLFWGKLWPFGMKQGRVISKPSVWSLWFKVVAATIPVLIISPLDDWMEAHFYNYITVAAMLILYGARFFVVENRRAAPHVSRLEQIPAQGGQVRCRRFCDDRHRGGCAGSGLCGGLWHEPCRHPLPDGLRQAPRFQVLWCLPHRAGHHRAGSGGCDGNLLIWNASRREPSLQDAAARHDSFP